MSTISVAISSTAGTEILEQEVDLNVARMFVGGASGVVKYRDEGSSFWVDITIPSLTNHSVRCMHATSYASLWVGIDRLTTTSGQPMIYYWDGSSWTEYLLPDQTGYTLVGGIWAVSDTEVYAVTCISDVVDSGRLYKYNGSSWTHIASYSGRPSGISGYNSSNIYVAYETDTDLVGIAKWNGTTFTKESSGNGIPDGYYAGVGILDPNNVYVVPCNGQAVYKGSLGSWTEEWDWSLDVDMTPSGYTTNKIWASQGTVIIATQNASNHGLIRTRDASGMWGKVNLDTLPIGGSPLNPGSPSAGGNRSLILAPGVYYSGSDLRRLEDGAWIKDGVTSTSLLCSTVYSESSSIIKEKYFFTTAGNYVTAFDVNAKLWINITKPGGFPSSTKYIHGTSKNDVWVGGTSYGGSAGLSAIYHFDGLKTWTEYLLPEPEGPYNDSVFGLWALASNSVFAYQKHSNSSYGAFCYFDGYSWSEISHAGPGTTISAGSLVAFSTNDVYIAGGTTSEIGLWHWDGATMTKSTTLPVAGYLHVGPSKNASEVFIAHSLTSVQPNGIAVYKGSFDSWTLDQQFTDTDIMSSATQQPKILYDRTTGKTFLYSAGMYERVREADGYWNTRTLIGSGSPTACWILDSGAFRAARYSGGMYVYKEGEGWQQYPDTYSLGLNIGEGSVWGYGEESAPFLEDQDPFPGETNVNRNALITFYIVDPDNNISPFTIDALVDGYDAYLGTVGFVSPYDGPDSYFGFFPSGSLEGYGAYKLSIDYTALYPLNSTITVRAKAMDTSYNQLDESWDFTTYSHKMFIDIEEGYGTGYVPAYDGSSFIAPYNNNSTVIYDDSDGYEGYNIIVKKSGLLTKGKITVDVTADGYEDHLYNLFPEAGAIDIPRATELRFRIRGNVVPVGEIFRGLGGWVD